MFKQRWILVLLAATIVPSGSAAAASGPKPPGFVEAVIASRPRAYYRLEDTNGSSEVGSTKYSSVGGATITNGCAPIGVPKNRCASLNGVDAYLSTTQVGGITTQASLMAWVDLAALPSKAGHFFYVAGESHYGNDLDVQFETDDTLKFYTASGSNIHYAPPPASLIGAWHMIVVTLDTVSGERAIYWDGKAVALDKDGGIAGKTSAFSIGYSTVFTGRWFSGRIDEVALWDRALKPEQVAALYKSTMN